MIDQTGAANNLCEIEKIEEKFDCLEIENCIFAEKSSRKNQKFESRNCFYQRWNSMLGQGGYDSESEDCEMGHIVRP